MSNRYQSDLNSLDDTIAWAKRQSASEIRSFIWSHIDKPVYMVGSGGSYTVAKYASQLHEDEYGCPSKAITPYEVLTNPAVTSGSAVLLISAGGNNTDIVAALSHLRRWEHSATASLCLNPSSQLVDGATQWESSTVIDIGSPPGEDGFLATHSLIAFCLLLAKAYSRRDDIVEEGEAECENLLRLISDVDSRESINCSTEALWERDQLIVLAGRVGVPAAVDIESKMSEAAIMPVQVLDYRNFAHGRHNWLAKKGSTTAVLGISGPRDRILAKRTHERLPDSIAQMRIVVLDDGAEGSLSALMAALYVVEAAADEEGLDAGNPGIPSFGRRIYNLKTIKYAARKPEDCRPAIRRKLESISYGAWRPGREIVRNAYNEFVTRVAQLPLKGVVFDYDGTLCRRDRRFEGMERSVAEWLEKLLDGRVQVGIVSGRGGSMGEDLRRVIDRAYWDELLVGYYNASVVTALSREQDPSELVDQSSGELERMAKAVEGSEVADLVVEKSRRRACQLTLFPSERLESLFRLVDEIRMAAGLHGLRLVMSTHSVDVIPAKVSKRQFVEEFCHLHGVSHEQVLRIGDRGDRLGNDFELLSDYPSVSVDRVSGSLRTCWNLGGPGEFGVQTTKTYLNALEVEDGVARFRVRALED